VPVQGRRPDNGTSNTSLQHPGNPKGRYETGHTKEWRKMANI